MAKRYAIYVRCVGKGPEPVAGPFYSMSDVDDHIDNMDIKMDDNNYFVDQYPMVGWDEEG